MAHRKSCDTCPSTSDEEYPTGWGVFMGFDPEKLTHGKKDLCPRCTLAIATAIVELRKMLAAKAVTDTTVAKADPPYDPNMPGNLGKRLPR